VVEAQIIMKTPRWIEQPRTLAALTLAFALMPAAVAFITFKAARERDAKLFDTATEVLVEQLKINTLRHQNFLNIMRNQWRYVPDSTRPPKGMPPPGWETRITHLRAIAYAEHEDETNIRVLWQQGHHPLSKVGDNLASHALLAPALKQARLSAAPLLFGAHLDENSMVVVGAVTSRDDNSLVRGYILGWIDLDSFCHDPTLPLLSGEALRARPISADATLDPAERRKLISDGENKAEWTVAVTRGPGFSREYGTPTPWIGFVALGLSVLPLSVLVMLAARASKLRSALEAEQLKNQFVSTVSHEFRTPLSVILSGAELLEAHAASLSETRRLELLTQIKTSTTRMNDMVEQVLLLGRIESGAMKANPQPVDVAALCREVVEEVQMATQGRCEIETNLFAGTKPLDATLMRSVLVNLLTNAVKYSKPGSTVHIDANASTITISDKGIGIPVEDQSMLGEPFHRASNVGEVAGTGLGLTVVRRCLALCGGTLVISSEEGQGTQVVITLPS